MQGNGLPVPFGNSGTANVQRGPRGTTINPASRKLFPNRITNGMSPSGSGTTLLKLDNASLLSVLGSPATVTRTLTHQCGWCVPSSTGAQFTENQFSAPA